MPAILDTETTDVHTFLVDRDGRARLFSFASIAFLVAETNRPQLRAAGFFPYLVHRAPSAWSIGLARSEAEAIRRSDLK